MSGYLVERICPVCGKKFIPAPYHVYKLWNEVSGHNILVCSYTCSLKEPGALKKKGKKE